MGLAGRCQQPHQPESAWWECHTPPSVERRTEANDGRTQALPGISGDADNHPDTASNDCTIFPVEHFRLHLRCKVLEM